MFEGMAPASASVDPYDTLADEYNLLAPIKKFRVHAEIPRPRYSLITMFNVLDHMDAPEELLAHLAPRLGDNGGMWMYVHIGRPFSPEEHPQVYAQASPLSHVDRIAMVSRHFSIGRCGLTREGRLFPYAWWAICRARGALGRWTQPLHLARCSADFARFHGARALVKGMKLAGLRRLLPSELRF